MRRGLVVGRAAGVWEEVEQATAMCTFDMILVVGRMGTVWPGRIDRWVSWHADLFERWKRLRRQAGYQPATSFWSGQFKGKRIPRGRVDPPVPTTYVTCGGGSSGYLAIKVAFSAPDPVDQVVLVGVPMDPERAHYDQREEWKQGLNYRVLWQEEAHLWQGRVKSMSGWTAKLFGAPTEEWLSGLS